MGTDDAVGGRLASETEHPPSLAERSLRRHTPEVGAVCGKAARTVLCGGRSVMGVPTASAAYVNARNAATKINTNAPATILSTEQEESQLATPIEELKVC